MMSGSFNGNNFNARQPERRSDVFRSNAHTVRGTWTPSNGTVCNLERWSATDGGHTDIHHRDMASLRAAENHTTWPQSDIRIFRSH